MRNQDIRISIIKRIFGYNRTTFPITYLGLPLRLRKLRRNDWERILERINKRLDGWRYKTLLIGGRVTLLKAIISTIPIYYMSYFKLPI